MTQTEKDMAELNLGIANSPFTSGHPNGKPARARRSDAGKPRPVKAQPSRLTCEQVAHIEKLRIEMKDADDAAFAAGDVAMNAAVAYHKYLDEITAK